MALITRLDSAVTNGSGLPLALPPVGVDGYVGRWIANSLTGADNSAVTSWPALVGAGTRDLVSPGGTASPLVKSVGTDRYVQFDGIDDVLTQSPTSAAWITTVLLGRFDGATSNSQMWAGAASVGPWLDRNSDDTVKAHCGANVDLSTFAATATKAPIGTWRVFTIVQNGASSSLSVDSTVLTGTAGTRVSSAMMLGKSDAGFGAVSIAEMLVYNVALTGAQIIANNTALRANHAALVA